LRWLSQNMHIKFNGKICFDARWFVPKLES